jgi:hypothetical protein
MLLRRAVDIAEAASRADMCPLPLDVDLNGTHLRHIERQAAVGKGSPGDVVPTALDREQDSVRLGEPDRGAHVVHRERLHHERGALRVHGVPDPNGLFEAGIALPKGPSVEGRREAVQRFGTDVDDGSVERGHPHAVITSV